MEVRKIGHLQVDDRLYRSDMLFTLQKDLLQELDWLNTISLKHIKNFQIWYPDYNPQMIES